MPDLKIGLENIKNLKGIDHWDLLLKMSERIAELSKHVEVIANNIDLREVGVARKQLAIDLAKVGAWTDLIRYKFHVRGDEWWDLVQDQKDLIVNELTTEERENTADNEIGLNNFI